MRKKGLAVLMLTLVLASGTASVTALAAQGWAQEGSNWIYYDSNGYKVSNEWKKGADNLWRYLNSSGSMALNSWVDDLYYVDSNGIMVASKWLKVEDRNSETGYVWYYFDEYGKAISDGWKKIDNKWYYFDSDKTMQTGWLDDDMYYCDANGVMKTGWQKLVPPDDMDDADRPSPSQDDPNDDGKYWYYFSASGKKYVPGDSKDGDEMSVHKIDGAYYCFDKDGQMQTGWTNMKDDDNKVDTIEDFKYFGADGKARSGWLSLEPPDNLEGYDGSVEWFYFGNNGTPKMGPKEGEASSSDLEKINSITYLFNEKGNPVYGLQKVYIGSSDTEYTAYYFGDKQTSSVQKGRRKIEEGDGTITEFYFMDNGRGYTGVKEGRLYYKGKLQTGESGSKYTVISMPSGSSYVNYVVNSSGKVAKGATVKDADGVKYKTNSSGVLTEVDGEAAGSGLYESPDEPIWKTD